MTRFAFIRRRVTEQVIWVTAENVAIARALAKQQHAEDTTDEETLSMTLRRDPTQDVQS